MNEREKVIKLLSDFYPAHPEGWAGIEALADELIALREPSEPVAWWNQWSEYRELWTDKDRADAQIADWHRIEAMKERDEPPEVVVQKPLYLNPPTVQPSGPVAQTLYAMRCGWCGAYEGTVDPSEPCAQDETGYIGPHQFGVLEGYTDPTYSTSRALVAQVKEAIGVLEHGTDYEKMHVPAILKNGLDAMLSQEADE